MKEKRGEMSPKSRRVLGKPPRCCMQLVSSEYDAALQNQQAKACWKCCKTPIKVTEIFCVKHRKFQQANMIDIICF
jgi:hypothetical protein